VHLPLPRPMPCNCLASSLNAFDCLRFVRVRAICSCERFCFWWMRISPSPPTPLPETGRGEMMSCCWGRVRAHGRCSTYQTHSRDTFLRYVILATLLSCMRTHISSIITAPRVDPINPSLPAIGHPFLIPHSFPTASCWLPSQSFCVGVGESVLVVDQEQAATRGMR